LSDVLTWLGTYSLPVALLIALGAMLLYFVKLAAEKAISREFDRYAKIVDLQLQRRSNFEEKILLERYTLLRELNARIDDVFTNLRRRRQGTDVEGLIRNGDIVPLTEIFELIGRNRYLLPKPFLIVLDEQAQLALQYANAKDQLTLDTIMTGVLALRERFDALMVKAFRLDEIGGLEEADSPDSGADGRSAARPDGSARTTAVA
jgi:hypothetical protein